MLVRSRETPNVMKKIQPISPTGSGSSVGNRGGGGLHMGNSELLGTGFLAGNRGGGGSHMGNLGLLYGAGSKTMKAKASGVEVGST